MLIAVDFDGTVVAQDTPYDDVTTQPRLQPGALTGLRALKNAGHVLLLYSARANRALRVDPKLDPLVRSGVRVVSEAEWSKLRTLHEARFEQMQRYARLALPGLFDAVDDGQQGKPSVDLYIDDKAVRFGVGPGSMSWAAIAHRWGEP